MGHSAIHGRFDLNQEDKSRSCENRFHRAQDDVLTVSPGIYPRGPRRGRVHGRNMKLLRMVERPRCRVRGAERAMVELIEGIDTARTARAVKTIQLL